VQLVPLAIVHWHGPDLAWLIPAVIVVRMLAVIPNLIELYLVMPLGVGGRFDFTKVRMLFSYGGWITVTNVLNPLLTALDRMVVGGMLSAEAVAFYTVPFNLVTRASVLPGAISGSIFPRLSKGTGEEASSLASRSLFGLAAVLTPILVVAAAILRIFMHYWVGESFASHAAPVGMILLFGIWFNAIAAISSTHLQAINRPDLPAIFHAFEVLPFVGILWAAVHFFGLPGAAWAWTLRNIVDAILLFAVAGRIPGWWRVVPGLAFLVLAALAAPSGFIFSRLSIELGIVAACCLWSWNLSPQIRTLVQVWFLGPAILQNR
jgi:O-antigen/teichoic acid export membrane protein